MDQGAGPPPPSSAIGALTVAKRGQAESRIGGKNTPS